MRDGKGKTPAVTTYTVEALSTQYRFFHWHLAFPQVFARGGFNVVLGNPPWERVKLQEQEYFAARNEDIANAPNAAARKRLIAALPEDNPILWKAWCEASRAADGESNFVRKSGRYPLCGRGDMNTYALFAEHNCRSISDAGRAGFITPTGIATDDTTSEFFAGLMESQRLESLFDFENQAGIFPSVHRSFKFSLVTVAGNAAARRRRAADFVFFAHSVDDLSDIARRWSLTASDIRLLNPSTRTCPVFRTKRDAELTGSIYRNAIVLGAAPEAGGWGADYLLKLVDPTIHRDLLLSDESEARDVVPLYEGKVIWHFDHRYLSFDRGGPADGCLVSNAQKSEAACVVRPRYWLRRKDFEERLKGRPVNYRGFLSVRDVTGVPNERTAVATIRPFVPALNSLGNLFCRSASDALFLCGCLNSFATDYVTRQKIGGNHLSPFYLMQLAIVSPAIATAPKAWAGATAVRGWIETRVLELTYTAWDLEAFAIDTGHRGSPFIWNPDRRFLLRAELDAAFFHLYGISHEDSAYILDTFPIVRKNDEKAFGEYRTKRVILEVYDAMAEAARTGRPYQTRLDPPPADPRVAHPASTKPRTS